MAFDAIDVRMMRRALSLAALGRGTSAPNPIVGAVVARGARVLGQGFHRKPGEPHAEALALSQLNRSISGTTLYTTLEPCCHTGRTPPCVDEIVRCRVKRVVASVRDPNPNVKGGGFHRLRRNGIRVDVGLLRNEAMHINAAFMKRARQGLPYVTLKAAMSLDGRIATRSGDSKWITSNRLRKHARMLRLENDGIVVGADTVMADDPRLNRRPRSSETGEFWRVVLDSSLRLSTRSQLVKSLHEGPVLVICRQDASTDKRRRLLRAGIDVEAVAIVKNKLDLNAVLELLVERGLSRVLVEGGGEVHASFVENHLADRLVIYCVPRLIGGRLARPFLAGEGVDSVTDAYNLKSVRWAHLADGWMIDGLLD